ncbi:hypothetical protein V6C03_03020 [Methyloligella sp. 2.7D]|uniref:hypothetical protein n=1 Tax=unclassified Methyloligella TaxID=2625955 RepID=UPI00157E0D18|nr:hypothetical protein [Methyloligella sp. GL2]QKP76405.1 hypothetical protein HT051_02400 [Methyloligella sp. GL2]
MLTRVLFVLVLICVPLGAAQSHEAKIVSLGLADHPLDEAELTGGAEIAKPHYDTAGVAYVLADGLKPGDTLRLDLMNRGRSLMYNTREVEPGETKVLLQAGKASVPAGGWPEGDYTAKVEVSRDGETLLTKESEPVPFD